jgi:hypothetical protein
VCLQAALTGMEELQQELLGAASEVAKKLLSWRQRSAAARAAACELLQSCACARLLHNRQVASLKLKYRHTHVCCSYCQRGVPLQDTAALGSWGTACSQQAGNLQLAPPEPARPWCPGWAPPVHALRRGSLWHATRYDQTCLSSIDQYFIRMWYIGGAHICVLNIVQ